MKRYIERCQSVCESLGSSIILLALGAALSGCQTGTLQASDGSAAEKQRVGWLEMGELAGVGSPTELKLDTGATTTSINAEILEKPDSSAEAGGMVRFRFLDTDDDSQVYERPVVEWVRIKDGSGGFFRRPVVEMQICVAGQWIEEKVNLADRSQFDYSVLIGRNMLKKGGLVIDSGETYTATADCPERQEAS